MKKLVLALVALSALASTAQADVMINHQWQKDRCIQNGYSVYFEYGSFWCTGSYR